MTIEDIEKILEKCWCKETSSDPDNWTEDNPSWGQCAITSLIVQDELGGELLRALLYDSKTSHYWNKLPSEEEVDLTRKQFKIFQMSTWPIIRDREYVLSFPDTKKRYELLRKKFDEIK